MGSWAIWDVARLRVEELRLERMSRPRSEVLTGAAAADSRSSTGRGRGHGLSAWVGYRMIGLGCRLARSAVVAGARSGL